MSAKASFYLQRMLLLVPLGIVLTAGFAIAGTLRPLLDFTGGSQTFAGGALTAGWQFTVSSPITVSALGLFDVDANALTNSHSVGLWTNSSTLLVQATVDNGSTPVSSVSGAGRWLFTSITPLTLSPGIYDVGAFYSPSDADLLMYHTALPTTISGVTFNTTRLGIGSALSYPNGGIGSSDNPGYFGPNLAISAVPAPSSIVSLATGLAAIALAIRRSYFASRRIPRPSSTSWNSQPS